MRFFISVFSQISFPWPLRILSGICNFVLEIFHFLPVSLTLVINLYFWISPRIFINIWNGPHGILRGLGETDSWKKTWSQNSRVRLPLKEDLKCYFIQHYVYFTFYSNEKNVNMTRNRLKLEEKHSFTNFDFQGPGIFFVIPCIDSYKCVDLRTVSFDVPPQEASENLPIRVHSFRRF